MMKKIDECWCAFEGHAAIERAASTAEEQRMTTAVFGQVELGVRTRYTGRFLLDKLVTWVDKLWDGKVKKELIDKKKIRPSAAAVVKAQDKHGSVNDDGVHTLRHLGVNLPSDMSAARGRLNREGNRLLGVKLVGHAHPLKLAIPTPRLFAPAD